jgi:hypothetical protein
MCYTAVMEKDSKTSSKILHYIEKIGLAITGSFSGFEVISEV